ncbi:MAG: hypothetical protein ACF8XB_06290 [Planctomycetota bacterium JB042]
MRRQKSPGFSLSVPYRRDAGRLPRSRSGRSLGVGWRGREARDPEAGLRTPSWVVPTVVGVLAVGFVVLIGLAAVDPKAVRRPPMEFLLVAFAVGVLGTALWLGRRLVLGRRERKRRAEEARLRRSRREADR